MNDKRLGVGMLARKRTMCVLGVALAASFPFFVSQFHMLSIGFESAAKHDRLWVDDHRTISPLRQKQGDRLTSLAANSDHFDPCKGYDGILWIQQGDHNGAFTTILYMFVINHIIYAKRNNLLPFVHLNRRSHVVYDKDVHPTPLFNESRMRVTFLQGKEPSTTNTSCPGPPIVSNKTLELRPFVTEFWESGVWSHYFEPSSNFRPHHAALNRSLSAESTCREKPLIVLKPEHVIHGLHFTCPWSVRGWRYWGVPREILHYELPYREWMRPMRETGASIVQKHIRPLAKYWEKAAELVKDTVKGNLCLAMHIRHSDKGARRKPIPVESFLPYVEVYVNAIKKELPRHDFAIFLATDSTGVMNEIKSTWPQGIVAKIASQGDEIIRSPNKTAAFHLVGPSHHRTNVEVLVDILAMSRCNFLLHGFSAVSEAVQFHNPVLFRNNQTVDLEDTGSLKSPKEFETLVQTRLAGTGTIEE